MVIKSPNLSTLEEEESLSGSFCYTSDSNRYQEWMNNGRLCEGGSESGSSRCGWYSAQSSRSDDSTRSRSPVSQWLYLIRDSTEVESLSALQAKSVAVNEESFEALSVRNAQVGVKKTRKDSAELFSTIERLIAELPLTTEDLPMFKGHMDQVSLKTQALIEHCRRRGCDHFETPVKGKQSSTEVAVYGMQICKFVQDFSRRRNVNNAQLEASLRKMQERLRTLTEKTLRADIRIIVQALRFAWGSICSKWALLAMWQLTQADPYISSLFLEDAYVVRRLMSLATIRSPTLNHNLPASALRILTHMSLVPSCIEQIFAVEDPHGDLISLLAFQKSELVLTEAVALIVQISMPLIDCKKILKQNNLRSSEDPASKAVEHLVKIMPVKSLVKALTSLARVCYSRTLMHLISASLANISFLDPESLVQNETCNNLLTAISQRFDNEEDIELKDQVVTILANISSTSPLEVVSSGGLVFLIACLKIRSPSAVRSVERETASGNNSSSSINSLTEREASGVRVERMHQKIAAAVARLAGNKSCACLLLRLNAVTRLVDLCRDPRERNYNDTVLLAALAALRRIAATTGIEPFRQLKCHDLVLPSLKQVFIVCSSQGESYV